MKGRLDNESNEENCKLFKYRKSAVHQVYKKVRNETKNLQVYTVNPLINYEQIEYAHCDHFITLNVEVITHCVLICFIKENMISTHF